jgi:hypothetical protein
VWRKKLLPQVRRDRWMRGQRSKISSRNSVMWRGRPRPHSSKTEACV